MQYNQPYGVSDPNAAYINGNPSTGTQGSIPPAASIEYPQREIVNVISDVGNTPTNADLHQLGKSIQGGRRFYGVDTSVTLGQVTVALTPIPNAYTVGMAVEVLMNNDSTGPTNVNLNALGNKVIVKQPGSSPLTGREWGTGDIVKLKYDGTNFQMAGAAARPPLPANTTIYVNTATGNDTTLDGSSPTVSGRHGPFKTIGRAMVYAAAFGPSAFTLTIQIADGTYAEAVATPTYAIANVVINGNNTTPANVLVTGANNKDTFACWGPNTLTVSNLKVSTGTGGGPPSCFEARTSGSVLTTINTESGSCAGGVFVAFSNGVMQVGSHKFSANSTYLYQSGNNGVILLSVSTHTITTPIIVTYSAQVQAGGQIQGGSISFVNPGNVAGQRYFAQLNGVINTAGAGANYFPGNVAGTVATGGQYV